MFSGIRKAVKEIGDALFGSRRFFVRAEHLGIYSQVIVWELTDKFELKEFGKITVDREDVCTNDSILRYAEDILRKANVASYSLRIF